MNSDIRWKQRFSNYQNALQQLRQGVEENSINPIALIKEGIIQRFEFTHELAWKVMRDYLEYEGIQNITGSRSAARESFNKGLVTDGQIWMDMIESRNLTVHTYNPELLEIEFNSITSKYLPALIAFGKKMESLL